MHTGGPMMARVAGVRESLEFCRRPEHLGRTVKIALAVGIVLTLINQGDVILSGGATPLTAIKVVANFLVPLTVANLGLLGARGSQPRMSTSSKKAARANQN